MSVSHTLSFAQTGGSTPLAGSVTVTGELATEANISVAGSTTDQQENIAFAYATLQEVYISSDVTVTLETNATNHAGGDIVTVTAGKPVVWYTGCGLANPFTANVTTTYWTNATGGAATIYMRTLVS